MKDDHRAASVLGQLAPFVLNSGAACAPPPTAYSGDPASQFFLDARDVYEALNKLSAEQ
jgi:hypothetical protein